MMAWPPGPPAGPPPGPPRGRPERPEPLVDPGYPLRKEVPAAQAAPAAKRNPVVVILTVVVLAALTAVGIWYATRHTNNAATPGQPTYSPYSTASATASSTRAPTTTTTKSTTSTPVSTTSPPKRAVAGTDAHGFVDYPGARCNAADVPAVMARTTKSVLVICQSRSGSFTYRGVRLSDGAGIELANAERSSGGFDVSNPSDGTRYQLRPNGLTILQPHSPVYSEPMVEYASS